MLQIVFPLPRLKKVSTSALIKMLLEKMTCPLPAAKGKNCISFKSVHGVHRCGFLHTSALLYSRHQRGYQMPAQRCISAFALKQL